MAGPPLSRFSGANPPTPIPSGNTQAAGAKAPESSAVARSSAARQADAAAAEDRQVSLARAAFAKGDYDAGLLRLQIAVTRHPGSPLVRHLLVRSLIATGGFDEAAFHVKVLLVRDAPAEDLATLYAPSAYKAPEDHAAQGRRLADFAAARPSDVTVRLLHAYWLAAVGEGEAAEKTLSAITDAAYAPHLAGLRQLIRPSPDPGATPSP
jgi:thioredoxin-like negative regulator of GroEL